MGPGAALVALAAAFGLLAAGLAAPAAASAEPQMRAPGQRARLERQARRIEQGVRSGALTREETRDLLRERRKIREDRGRLVDLRAEATRARLDLEEALARERTRQTLRQGSAPRGRGD